MCADETTIGRQLQWVQHQYRRELAALRHEVIELRRELAALHRAHGNDRDGARESSASHPDGNLDLRVFSAHGYGLYAASDEGTGVYCRSFGEGDGLSALSERGTGVAAVSLGQGDGICAQSARGNGVHAVGGAALGNGQSPRPAGVFAEGGAGFGIHAASTTGDGVAAISASGCAVDAFSDEGIGVRARSASRSEPALEIEGRIRIRGCALGEVCLQEGVQRLTVSTAAATADSMILLTPLDDPGEAVRIWVSARGAGAFTISASAPPRADVRVQYLIVN